MSRDFNHWNEKKIIIIKTNYNVCQSGFCPDGLETRALQLVIARRVIVTMRCKFYRYYYYYILSCACPSLQCQDRRGHDATFSYIINNTLSRSNRVQIEIKSLFWIIFYLFIYTQSDINIKQFFHSRVRLGTFIYFCDFLFNHRFFVHVGNYFYLEPSP